MPRALLKAIASLQGMPGYEGLNEEAARQVMPRGLDGYGPDSEEAWIDFIMFAKRNFKGWLA